MMLPGQIKNYQLNPTKQGTYKASEVEAFRQKVYVAFCEMLSENNALKEKFVSLSDLVNEYNKGKNSIATTLIKSQTLADETVKNAQTKADEIIAEAESKAKAIYDSKVAEADEYAASKTATADEYFERAKTELDNVLASIGSKADEYIAEINKKAAEIITNANEQASGIVARAYADAQKAKETCDSILENASLALPSVKNDVDMFKSQTLQLISAITDAVEAINVPDDIDFVPAEIEEIKAETVDPVTLPKFEIAEEVPFEEVTEEQVESVAFVDMSDEIDDNDSSDDKSSTDYIFDKFTSFDDIFNSTDV